MAQLKLIDRMTGTNRTMKFTVGDNMDLVQENWPIYVIDRLTSSVKNEQGLYQLFLDHNMVPNSLQKSSMDNLYFRLYNDDEIKEKIIFDNPFIAIQASHLMSPKKKEASSYRIFLEQFNYTIQDYDAREYLKKTFGENHPLTRFSIQYVFKLKEYETTNNFEILLELEDIKDKLDNIFQDYNFLRNHFDIIKEMTSYMEKKEKSRIQAEKIQKKLLEKQSLKVEKDGTNLVEEKPISISFDDLKSDENIRSLCLVIGSKIPPLVLMEDKSSSLDNVIIEKFKDSNDVRKNYDLQIEEFLIREQNYLNQVREALKKPNYKGQIVILEKDSANNFKLGDDGQYLRVSVLYSSIWKEIKNLTLNTQIMKRLINQDMNERKKDLNYRPLFSEFDAFKMRIAIKKQASGIANPYKIEKTEWIKNLKTGNNISTYDRLRKLKHFIKTGTLKISPFKKEEISDNFLDTQTKTIAQVQIYGEQEEFLDEEEYQKAFFPEDTAVYKK